MRLASMDIRTENIKDIALFFTMLNEILQKVTGKPNYKFNSRYFVCDEGSANHKAIKYVYGEEFAKARVVGCKWHFRKNATMKARPMPEDIQDIFNKTCKKLCKSTTITNQYNLLKGELEELAKKHPTLNPWIQWWHVHRSHIFAPFRVGGLTGVNLSEMENAGWESYNTLGLVHADKQDTATMILQEKEIYLFNRNQTKSTGSGPSKAVRNSGDRQEQIKIAGDFVNILDVEETLCQKAEQAENPNAFIPRGSAKQKPPKKAKTNDVQEESKKATKGRKKTAPKRENIYEEEATGSKYIQCKIYRKLSSSNRSDSTKW